MGRFFILGFIFLFFFHTGLSQNLLLNGDFEEVAPSYGKQNYYLDNFYFSSWFEPTESSPDIYRDVSVCNNNFTKNIEPGLDFCVSTASGNYAVGFYALSYRGYMEHITGTLMDSLIAGKSYKISFYMKFFGDYPYFSKAIGYKMSKDSIPFNSNELFSTKMSPFYQHLFKKNKVYADFQFADYQFDSSWVKYTTSYTAKGGEKFITFGQFSFKNDSKLLKQLKRFSRNSSEAKLNKFIQSNKSNYIQYFNGMKPDKGHGLGGNYYLLDNIQIIEFTKNEQKLAELKCKNCVDLDPITLLIPNRKQLKVDRGFFGDMQLVLRVRLKPMEKYVLKYGKNGIVVIINTNKVHLGYSETTYTLRYPARKMKKKPIEFYVERISKKELLELDKYFLKKEYIDNSTFKGIIYKNK